MARREREYRMGRLQTRSVWTRLGLAVLASATVFGGWYMFFGDPVVRVLGFAVFATSFFSVALLGLETRRSVGMVILGGVGVTVFGVAYSLVVAGDAMLAAITTVYLVVPAIAALSYRHIPVAE